MTLWWDFDRDLRRRRPGHPDWMAPQEAWDSYLRDGPRPPKHGAEDLVYVRDLDLAAWRFQDGYMSRSELERYVPDWWRFPEDFQLDLS